jgi:hypothetical protein
MREAPDSQAKKTGIMESKKADKPKTKQELDEAVNQTKSDSDFYKRTFIGTGAPKSDENFDNESRQSGEKDLEDRDNNDGDANTENNF